MEWKQNPLSKGKTIEEYYSELFQDFIGEKTKSEFYKVQNMDKASQLILMHLLKPIRIIGDYDADGICSTTELTLLLRDLGAINFSVRLPKRFSEGYGLSDKIVQEILENEEKVGLIILVDNGITSVSGVKKLKENGWKVLILDHHLPSEDGIPDADVLIDPHAETLSDFSDYCGAGLVYKLAQYMKDFLKSKTTLNKILSLACIGTIADSVKLIEGDIEKKYDNYLLVRDGLLSLKTQEGRTTGLYTLLRELNLDYSINEEQIAYTLAPTINAAGRLYDNGASKVLNLLIMDDNQISKAEKLSRELISDNEKRKEETKKILPLLCEEIEDKHMENDYPLVVFKEGIHPGLVGLLAGKLSEQYQTAVIVLTSTEKENICSGSARAQENMVHLKDMLNNTSDLLEKYGGHAQAAGLSILMDNIEDFRKRTQLYAGEKPKIFHYYDFEIAESQMRGCAEEIEKYAPYGYGNSNPIFKVKYLIPEQTREHYSFLGTEKKVLKIHGKNSNVIEFSGLGKELYEKLNYTRSFFTYGSISLNNFMGKITPQVIMKDIEKIESFKKETSTNDDVRSYLQNLINELS